MKENTLWQQLATLRLYVQAGQPGEDFERLFHALACDPRVYRHQGVYFEFYDIMHSMLNTSTMQDLAYETMRAPFGLTLECHAPCAKVAMALAGCLPHELYTKAIQVQWADFVKECSFMIMSEQYTVVFNSLRAFAAVGKAATAVHHELASAITEDASIIDALLPEEYLRLALVEPDLEDPLVSALVTHHQSSFDSLLLQLLIALRAEGSIDAPLLKILRSSPLLQSTTVIQELLEEDPASEPLLNVACHLLTVSLLAKA